MRIKKKGTEVDLTKLKKGQTVGYGDGKTYHYLYFDIPSQITNEELTEAVEFVEANPITLTEEEKKLIK